MAGLAVTFGNGGASNVSDLLSIDAQNSNALDDSTQQHETTNGNGSSIGSGPVTVGGPGVGGEVALSFDPEANAFVFDVVGKWNSVRNVLAQSDSAENVYFKDFVQADVHLGGSSASSVEILNVKRANVSTGAGNDTVTISLLTNDSSWVNAVAVNTGAGNDTITIKSGVGFKDGSDAGTGGITGATAFNGGNGFTDGRYTTVDIKAGAGNDTVDLSGVNLKSSTVEGGTGIDHLIASSGADTFVFHLGDMAKSIITDTIDGFNATMDKLKLVGTVENDWTATDFGGDAVVQYVGADLAHKGETIVLSNVDAGGFHNWFTA